MRKLILIVLILAVSGSISIIGCTQKAATSQEAIERAEEFQTVEEKTDYLIKQANAFLDSEEFDEGIETAQYILTNLDTSSEEAQNILETAKAELGRAAEGVMEGAPEVEMDVDVDVGQ